MSFVRKMQLAMSKINIIQNNIYRNVLFSNTSPEIFQNFQGIHCYVVNVRKYCVYSINSSCHRRKFVASRRIINRAGRCDLGYLMTRYGAMSHTILPFCLSAQIVIRRPDVNSHDASSELLNAHKNPIKSCDDEYPRSCGNCLTKH